VVAGGVKEVMGAAKVLSTLKEYVISATGVNSRVTPLDVIVLEGVFVTVGAGGAANVVNGPWREVVED
jgi:hypothetical protein